MSQEKTITAYMPMAMREWPEALQLPESTPCSVAELATVPGSIGFIPLYSSIEALQAVHGYVFFKAVRVPTSEIQAIVEKSTGGDQ